MKPTHPTIITKKKGVLLNHLNDVYDRASDLLIVFGYFLFWHYRILVLALFDFWFSSEFYGLVVFLYWCFEWMGMQADVSGSLELQREPFYLNHLCCHGLLLFFSWQENGEWVEWQTNILLKRNMVENVFQWACGWVLYLMSGLVVVCAVVFSFCLIWLMWYNWLFCIFYLHMIADQCVSLFLVVLFTLVDFIFWLITVGWGGGGSCNMHELSTFFLACRWMSSVFVAVFCHLIWIDQVEVLVGEIIKHKEKEYKSYLELLSFRHFTIHD